MFDNNNYKINEEGPSGKQIKEIIIQATHFIVFIDAKDRIDWSTEEEYGDFHKSFGVIQNRISFWESMSNKIFSKKCSFDYKCLLAEGYARIIDDKNEQAANDIINLTIERIKKHAKEVLKQQYIIASFVCTLIDILAIGVVVYCKKAIVDHFSIDAFEVLLTSLFGGVGAFIFATIRLKSYEPEIAISNAIHRIDGALRVFYGMISGLVIALGIKANIILGFINQVHMTIYLKMFLGIIAGASELIIPNLIKQIEGGISTNKANHTAIEKKTSGS